MTPMKYLKDLFNDLNSIIGEPVDLNKSSPKEYRNGWENIRTKGVKSDFIRIYKSSDNKSFAFAFNNLDNKNGTITVLTKETISNNSYFLDRTFIFEDFKNRLKSFIKTMKILEKSKVLNADTKKETIYSIFDLDISKDEIDKLTNISFDELKLELKIIRSKVKLSKKKLINVTKEVEKAEKDFNLEKTKLRKELGIEELKLELINKEKELKSRTKKLNANIFKKMGEKITLDNEHNNYVRKLNDQANEIIFKLPQNIHQKMIDKIDELIQ